MEGLIVAAARAAATMNAKRHSHSDLRNYVNMGAAGMSVAALPCCVEAVMMIRRSVSMVIAVSSLAALGSVRTAGQQRPDVQIPQPGVPQIMTLEGKFVRVAYNNEAYVLSLIHI